MHRYLFIFGYEDPGERIANRESGSGYESSQGVWIQALSRDSAISIGQAYARIFVDAVYRIEGAAEIADWQPDQFANWIEDDPDSRFNESGLDELPVIAQISDHLNWQLIG